jgi:acetolactate synthase-1/2/3 large subunit
MLQAPVVTSWSARGSVVEDAPLIWPMIHIKECTAVRNAADLVLCIGSRLGETDFWGKAPYWPPAEEQELIRVDIEETALDLNRTATLGILSDAKLFLQDLVDILSDRIDETMLEARGRLLRHHIRDRDRERAKLDEKLSDYSIPMVTAHVPVACAEVFGDNAVTVIDGGNTAVWGQFYHTVRRANRFLSTPHFGHLGAGTGQALGAAVARPDSYVYCITGDGAFGFHLQEIETAVRHHLPVVFLVVCDKQWGMVKMTQQFALRPLKTVVRKSLQPHETVATELCEIRFDLLAESMGAHGERVEDPRELGPALRRSLDSGRCAVIHVDVDPVKHLWAPGLRAFKKMHEEPKGS